MLRLPLQLTVPEGSLVKIARASSVRYPPHGAMDWFKSGFRRLRERHLVAEIRTDIDGGWLLTWRYTGARFVRDEIRSGSLRFVTLEDATRHAERLLGIREVSWAER